MRNLATAAAELLERAAAAPAGRAPLTLDRGAGAPLKQTLLALRSGAELAEHEAPGAATLQVLGGRLRLAATRAGSWVGPTTSRSRPPASRIGRRPPRPPARTGRATESTRATTGHSRAG